MATSTADSPTRAAKARPVFATTEWTRVLAARGDDTDARAALSELCGTYYEPVLAFLRGSGRNEDAARELAHEFFARLLERPSLDRLERGRSRFRSYLLGAVKHFLADAQARVAAKRRGGGQEHVPLRAASDTTAAVDPPDPKAASPETEFDRQWAVTLLDRALHDLATEHTTRAERRQFEVLKPWLTGDAAGLSQRDAARQLAMNEGAIKVAIHRLRRRFRAAVKARIRDTVSSAEEVPGELDYLIRILGS